MVERSLSMRQVVGSMPIISTFFFFCFILSKILLKCLQQSTYRTVHILLYIGRSLKTNSVQQYSRTRRLRFKSARCRRNNGAKIALAHMKRTHIFGYTLHSIRARPLVHRRALSLLFLCARWHGEDKQPWQRRAYVYVMVMLFFLFVCFVF